MKIYQDNKDIKLLKGALKLSFILLLSLSFISCNGDVFNEYGQYKGGEFISGDVNPAEPGGDAVNPEDSEENNQGLSILDTSPPQISSVIPIYHTRINIEFSEILDEISATTASNYHIQGSNDHISALGADIESDQKTVILSVESGMSHGSEYTLLVQNVADINHNKIQNASKQFTGRGEVTAELSGAPGTITNITSINITVSGNDIISYMYNMDGNGWSSEINISSNINISGLSESYHELKVVGKDSMGNWQEIAGATTHTWDIDITAPAVELSNLPNNPTNLQTTDIIAGGADVAAYKYIIDGDPNNLPQETEINISTHIALSGLSEGEHTIYSIGRDSLGNWQDAASAAPFTWYIDLTAPTAVLSDTPANPTNNDFANITVGGADITEYMYKLDSGSWSLSIDISSPINLSGLGETSHTVYVIGMDSANNWQEPANATTYTWTVDMTAPDAILTNTPGDPTSSDSVNIDVGGVGVAAYLYKLDSGSWSSEIDIDTDILLSGLSETSHTIFVVGRDSAGNWQDTGSPANYTWTVDMSAPAPPAVADTGAFDSDLLLSFTWTNPVDAAEIKLQVAVDSGFSNIVFGGADGVTVGSAELYEYIVSPANGSRYYARVKVRDAANNWSSFGAESDGIDVAGTVSGKIKNSNNKDIQGAAVELKIMSDSSLIYDTTSDRKGNFSFSNAPIGANYYRAEVSKTGYNNAIKNNISVSAGANTDTGIIYIVSSSASPGTITGNVVDANDGGIIQGALITVKNCNDEVVDTRTSDAAGYFTTNTMTAGTYSITISRTGFFDLNFDNIAVDGNIDIYNQPLCEVLTGSDVRIVLVWGESPNDLDLHVVGPSNQTVSSDGDPANRFHVYRDSQMSFNENDGAYSTSGDPDGSFSTTSLVQNVTNNYGPETINLSGYGTGYAYGIYTFTVHNRSKTSWYTSPITLRVFDSQGMAMEMPIPADGGRKWHWQAFKIDIQGSAREDRTITVKNTFKKLNSASKSSMDW